MLRHSAGLLISAVALCLLAGPFRSLPAADGEWGRLTGRFVYGGKAPARAKLELNKDIEFCSKFDPRSEELVVDPKTRGIANVVLWLEPPRSGPRPAVHPSYEKLAEKPAVLDNAGCRFDPHVVLVRTGQKLVVENSDEVPHSAQIFFLRNAPANALISRTGDWSREIEKAEPVPAKVACSIHAWMSAYVVVKDHPYVARTGADGTFELKNVPAGEWTFRVWQERAGYVDAVTTEQGPVEWAGGRFTVTIEPEKTTDLGPLELAPKLFEDD